MAGVRDARADFQQEFCAQYAKQDEKMPDECESWVWQALPKSNPAHGRPNTIARESRSLVVVPGIFGECVAQWVTPFSDSYEELRNQGHVVYVIPVSGRGSSRHNAAIIHAYMLEHHAKLKDALVVAYSKGLSDFMLAASDPRAAAWRDHISGLVAVAGTANGSPIANRTSALYGTLLEKLPMDDCGPADGGGVDSLTYRQAMAVRDGFLALSDPIPTYTVAAVSSPRSVNPMLRAFLRALSTIDDRNDGQLLLEDAVLPRSTLLGIYRADHWSIALPFESSKAWQVQALGLNNRFPRRALIVALMDFVPRRTKGRETLSRSWNR